MGRYSDQWDSYECEWCRVRGNWRRRPCLLRACQFQGMRRVKREACERVRMENAAKREKTFPKVIRRAMMGAVAEAKDKAALDASIRTTNTEVSVVDEPRKLDIRRMIVEADSETDTRTETRSKPTPKLRHLGIDAKKTQKQQATLCTGLKGMIEEGLSLAADDGDVARIYAANRKAWPRGQEPIVADATADDREIAELVRLGLIGAEDLQVDHDDCGGTGVRTLLGLWKQRKRGGRGVIVGGNKVFKWQTLRPWT